MGSSMFLKQYIFWALMENGLILTVLVLWCNVSPRRWLIVGSGLTLNI
jgi:hypothetical protein